MRNSPDTRKPRELLARFEEIHFGGRSFMSLTYLLTWPFVIHSQSQLRICWLKICLTVTPEWAVHSRPRYQDSVQVNRILCSIVMSCNWEEPIFKDTLLAVYGCNTDTVLFRVLVKGARSSGDVVLMYLQILWTSIKRNITQFNLST